MRLLLIFTLSITSLFPVFAQTQANKRSHKLDSLKIALPTLDVTEKTKAYLQLSQGYARESLDKSIAYADSAMDLALQRNDLAQLVIAYDLSGQGNSRQGKHILSMDLFNRGLRAAQILDDKNKEAHLMNSIGIEHAKTGEYEKALAYFLSSLEIWRKFDDPKESAITLNNIGLLQLKLDQPQKAISTLEEAMEIAQQIASKPILSTSWNNLGQVHEELGEYDEALDYYSQALEVKKMFRQKLAALPSYSNIFSVHSHLEQYDSAQVYYEIAWNIATEQRSLRWMQKLLAVKGEAAEQQGNFQEALGIYLSSLAYTDTLNSADAAKDIRLKLANVYAELDSFEVAFRYFKSHEALKDSILSQRSLSQIAEMQTKYDLSAKEQQIEQYQKEELINKYQMVILLVVVVLSLTALLAIFSRYRVKQQAATLLEKRNQAIQEKNEQLQKKSLEILAKNKMMESQSDAIQFQNRQLAQSNADLERFAYVASHDLREPLRTIRSYMQLLQKRYGERLDHNAHEFIEFAADGAIRMDELLQDLMEYSRIGRTESHMRRVDLNMTLSRVEDSLAMQIAENDAKIIYSQLPELPAYESEMHQLFQNLISNAIKFRREVSPEIRIGVRLEGDNYLFFIADNGIGIPEEHQEKVFTIFQRLHTRDQYEGTGIGLAICNKIIQGHGGSIRFESIPGKGTIFYLSLPAKQPHPLPEPNTASGA